MGNIITETERWAVISENVKSEMKRLSFCHFLEGHKEAEGNLHENESEE
jgi:hypothetical protein